MDRQEFISFYAATFPQLVGQLYAMTGDQAEAQDAVQEAFVRAWAHHGKIDRAGAPEAWVRVTAWRIAASRWRRTRQSRRLMLLTARPESTAGPTPTGLLSLMPCAGCPQSSAARWSCITCVT